MVTLCGWVGGGPSYRLLYTWICTVCDLQPFQKFYLEVCTLCRSNLCHHKFASQEYAQWCILLLWENSSSCQYIHPHTSYIKTMTAHSRWMLVTTDVTATWGFCLKTVTVNNAFKLSDLQPSQTQRTNLLQMTQLIPYWTQLFSWLWLHTMPSMVWNVRLISVPPDHFQQDCLL